MASKLKNLPPEVQRELLRHVKPRSIPPPHGRPGNTTATAAAAASSRKSPWPVVAACTAFVGFGCFLPYWATQTIGNLTEREEALTAAQVRRGAFMNSGSHDAGKDPNWDWKNGRYIYPKGFAEHLQKQNPNETDFGPDIGPMIQQQQRQQQQQQQQQTSS